MIPAAKETKEKLEQLLADFIVIEAEKSDDSTEEESSLAQTQETVTQSVTIQETDYTKVGYHLDINIPPEHLCTTVNGIKEMGYFIENITGVDWPKEEQIEAVYDFNRFDKESCRICLRTRTTRTKPSLDSISSIYTGANWHERETHDFFGIDFVGHPHLIPLLLPEDADFHPLLKDFKA